SAAPGADVRRAELVDLRAFVRPVGPTCAAPARVVLSRAVRVRAADPSRGRAPGVVVPSHAAPPGAPTAIDQGRGSRSGAVRVAVPMRGVPEAAAGPSFAAAAVAPKASAAGRVGLRAHE